MRNTLYAVILTLLSIAGGCAAGGPVAPPGTALDYSRLGDTPTAAERRLLVTFEDRTIGRAVTANAQDGYVGNGSSYGNSDWSTRVARALAQRHRIQMVAQWPVTELGVSCVVYEVPASVDMPHVMQALAHDERVVSAQPMQSFNVMGAIEVSARLQANPAYGDPYFPLQTSFNTPHMTEWRKKATGRGIRIALIDTGVDTDHPDLRGQIDHSENMAPEPPDHDTADRHGTAVAGVLSAKSDNGIGIAGIAPDAEVLSFRACWPEHHSALSARCNSFTLALALNQAIRMNSHIINLSLSGPEDPLLHRLVQRAMDRGIIVIAAVPGKGQSGGFPADMPGVIAVGQGDESNATEVVAPGRDILTTVPRDSYDFMSGNSFATPHVAGLAALMLELHPKWQAARIAEELRR